jgi:hypothetical protein
MANFKQDILAVIKEDPIQAVVISAFREGWGESKTRFIPGNNLAGQIIQLPEALEALDYEYESGFGCQDCHSIYLYSADWVYYIHEYDGATGIVYLPRNPTPAPSN